MLGNLIEDPFLHVYYDKIINITRGPIFSCERFFDILNMNTGRYQYLVDLYLSNQEKQRTNLTTSKKTFHNFLKLLLDRQWSFSCSGSKESR